MELPPYAMHLELCQVVEWNRCNHIWGQGRCRTLNNEEDNNGKGKFYTAGRGRV